MVLKLLGRSDGRVPRALRSIVRLVRLGLSDEDTVLLMRACRKWMAEQRATRSGRHCVPPASAERRLAAETTVRTLMALGFSEKHVALLIDKNHGTISHLLNPSSRRTVSEQTAAKLQEVLDTAGAERLRRLIPALEVKVLDTCIDQGYALTPGVREQVSVGVRDVLQHALLGTSCPGEIVAHVSACLVQLGHSRRRLYILSDLAEPANTVRGRIAQLRGLEHEADHLLRRLREERRTLENRAYDRGDDPKDGFIA